jgi:hypothetical protein
VCYLIKCLAQMVERLAYNEDVSGSSPLSLTVSQQMTKIKKMINVARFDFGPSNVAIISLKIETLKFFKNSFLHILQNNFLYKKKIYFLMTLIGLNFILFNHLTGLPYNITDLSDTAFLLGVLANGGEKGHLPEETSLVIPTKGLNFKQATKLKSLTLELAGVLADPKGHRVKLNCLRNGIRYYTGLVGKRLPEPTEKRVGTVSTEGLSPKQAGKLEFLVVELAKTTADPLFGRVKANNLRNSIRYYTNLVAKKVGEPITKKTKIVLTEGLNPKQAGKLKSLTLELTKSNPRVDGVRANILRNSIRYYTNLVAKKLVKPVAKQAEIVSVERDNKNRKARYLPPEFHEPEELAEPEELGELEEKKAGIALAGGFVPRPVGKLQSIIRAKKEIALGIETNRLMLNALYLAFVKKAFRFLESYYYNSSAMIGQPTVVFVKTNTPMGFYAVLDEFIARIAENRSKEKNQRYFEIVQALFATCCSQKYMTDNPVALQIIRGVLLPWLGPTSGAMSFYKELGSSGSDNLFLEADLLEFFRFVSEELDAYVSLTAHLFGCMDLMSDDVGKQANALMQLGRTPSFQQFQAVCRKDTFVATAAELLKDLRSKHLWTAVQFYLLDSQTKSTDPRMIEFYYDEIHKITEGLSPEELVEPVGLVEPVEKKAEIDVTAPGRLHLKLFEPTEGKAGVRIDVDLTLPHKHKPAWKSPLPSELLKPLKEKIDLPEGFDMTKVWKRNSLTETDEETEEEMFGRNANRLLLNTIHMAFVKKTFRFVESYYYDESIMGLKENPMVFYSLFEEFMTKVEEATSEEEKQYFFNVVISAHEKLCRQRFMTDEDVPSQIVRAVLLPWLGFSNGTMSFYMGLGPECSCDETLEIVLLEYFHFVSKELNAYVLATVHVHDCVNLISDDFTKQVRALSILGRTPTFKLFHKMVREGMFIPSAAELLNYPRSKNLWVAMTFYLLHSQLKSTDPKMCKFYHDEGHKIVVQVMRQIRVAPPEIETFKAADFLKLK